MWIKNKNDATDVLRRDWLDEPVEFSDNGKAQVRKTAGERLVREHDSIVEANTDSDGDSEEDDE